MYNNLEKAIYFATLAHSGQKRKNEDIDFIIHPYTVGIMLKEIGLSEEYVISGILHDIIEDTKYTYFDIKENFGEKIANNILKVSENKKILKWKERKEEFLVRLETEKDTNVLLLECADKLHNLLSDYEKYKKIGNKIWNSSLADYEENKWYYKSILNILKIKTNNSLIDRYEDIVNEYFPK